jgi:hypothetical protein
LSSTQAFAATFKKPQSEEGLFSHGWPEQLEKDMIENTFSMTSRVSKP